MVFFQTKPISNPKVLSFYNAMNYPANFCSITANYTVSFETIKLFFALEDFFRSKVEFLFENLADFLIN